MTKALATLCVVFFAYALATVPTAALPVFVGAYVDLLSYDIQAAGFLASIEAAGSVVGVVFTTLVIARPGVDLRRSMAIALALFCMAQLASCAPQHYALFAIARFVTGFAGSGLVGAIGSIYLAKLPSPDRAFAMYFGLQYAAGALALFTLPRLVPLAGLPTIYILLAVLAFGALLSTKFLPNIAAEGAREVDSAPKRAAIPHRKVLATILIISLFVNYIGNGGVWIYWERIGNSLQIDVASRSIALSLGLLAGIAGAVTCSATTHFLSRFAGIVAGHLILCLAYILPLLSKSPYAYGGGAALLSAAVAFLTPFYFAAIAEADESGRMVTAALSAIGIGYSVGPILLLPFAASVAPLLIAALVTAIASLSLASFVKVFARHTANGELLGHSK